LMEVLALSGDAGTSSIGPACGDVGTITNGGDKALAPAATTTEYVGTADGV